MKDTLGDRPHLAVALNANPRKDSDRYLRTAVMQLRVAGLPLKNLDPYQREQKVLEQNNKSMLNVRLNGNNYVSEKTRVAFEKALEDGYKVNAANSTDVTPATLEQISTQTMPEPSMNSPLNYQDGQQVKLTTAQIDEIPVKQSMLPIAANSSVDISPALPETIPAQPIVEPSVNSPLNYKSVLSSFEYSIGQFHQHQAQTLDVHAQFANHQMEYAKVFFHLMQQQNCLFSNSNSFEQQVETKIPVLESLDRNMMRFHDHQGETLRIHQQSLNHQAEYAKNFFQLIQQQYHLLSAGDSTHQRGKQTQAVANVVSSRDILVEETATAKQDNSVIPLTTAPIAIPTSELVINPYPTSVMLTICC